MIQIIEAPHHLCSCSCACASKDLHVARPNSAGPTAPEFCNARALQNPTNQNKVSIFFRMTHRFVDKKHHLILGTMASRRGLAWPIVVAVAISCAATTTRVSASSSGPAAPALPMQWRHGGTQTLAFPLPPWKHDQAPVPSVTTSMSSVGEALLAHHPALNPEPKYCLLVIITEFHALCMS